MGLTSFTPLNQDYRDAGGPRPRRGHAAIGGADVEEFCYGSAVAAITEVVRIPGWRAAGIDPLVALGME